MNCSHRSEVNSISSAYVLILAKIFLLEREKKTQKLPTKEYTSGKVERSLTEIAQEACAVCKKRQQPNFLSTVCLQKGIKLFWAFKILNLRCNYR